MAPPSVQNAQNVPLLNYPSSGEGGSTPRTQGSTTVDRNRSASSIPPARKKSAVVRQREIPLSIGGPMTNRNSASEKGEYHIDPKDKGKKARDPRGVEPRNFEELMKKPKRVVKTKVIGERVLPDMASKVALDEIPSLREKYNIPSDIDILVPGPLDRMYMCSFEKS